MTGLTDDDVLPRVCYRCVNEAFLRREIRMTGKRGECFDCGESDRSWTVAELAQRVKPAFERHYQLTATGPDDIESSMLRNGLMDGGWNRTGDLAAELLQEFVGISSDIADAVVESLMDGPDVDPFDQDSEDPYGGDALYERRSPDESEVGRQWQFLEAQVHHGARFFNQTVRRDLQNLFQGIEDKRTFGRATVIRELAPGAKGAFLYRARVAFRWAQLAQILQNPPAQLGAPAGRMSRAGRMNAAGIGVFYGALELQTCVAEIRAPVGSNVVLGKFELLRPIRLLDLPALQEVLVKRSVFDPDYERIAAKCAFLRILAHRFSAPVLPGEEEFEYLLPQVVCEFLAEEIGLDGVVYASSQRGGRGTNVALFPKASVVEPLPPGVETELTTSHDEDQLPTLVIRTPQPDEADVVRSEENWDFSPEALRDARRYDRACLDEEDMHVLEVERPALRLLLDEIKVVSIEGVSYRQQTEALHTMSLPRQSRAKPREKF